MYLTHGNTCHFKLEISAVVLTVLELQIVNATQGREARLVSREPDICRRIAQNTV